MARPAVFLDRDGTIIREVDYLRSVAQLRLLPGAAAAIRRLNNAGFMVIITTNQSGIARGLLTEADLSKINAVLCKRLSARGATIDAIYYCPHHPEIGIPPYRRRCQCRKPAPGMLLRAAKDLQLDLSHSYSVGDSERDLAAGRKVGARTVLVRTGYGRKIQPDKVEADYIAHNLADAADWIIRQSMRDM